LFDRRGKADDEGESLMKQTLVTVRYTLTGDGETFRKDMDKAAALIVETPGLIWKIWGFEPELGFGLSAYLFESEAAAYAFVGGPVIKGLRERPDVSDVIFEMAGVDQGLSAMTGASTALATRSVSQPA
jgi:hypothetical protein